MAATDKALGTLHQAVATGLTEALKPVPLEGGGILQAPPAYFAAAIAFLKNNNITADPTTNKDLAELGDALRRRRNNRLTPQQMEEAADQFALSQGYGVLN